MRLIKFQLLAEGERTAKAALVVWWKRRSDKRLRALGLSIYIPLPWFADYMDHESGCLVRGWRFPMVAIAMWHGMNQKWRPRWASWMQPIGMRTVLATQEEIEDGLYPRKD